MKMGSAGGLRAVEGGGEALVVLLEIGDLDLQALDGGPHRVHTGDAEGEGVVLLGDLALGGEERGAQEAALGSKVEIAQRLPLMLGVVDDQTGARGGAVRDERDGLRFGRAVV